MSSAPGPLTHYEDGYTSAQHPSDPHRAQAHRISTIPDLRFESSYLRSVRRYAIVLRISPLHKTGTTTTSNKTVRPLSGDDDFEKIEGKETGAHEKTVSIRRPLEYVWVDWRKVFWVTVRDQIVSPFLQGALWALVSYYISPFSSQLGSRMGTFVHQSIPTKEGSGVTWLRSWAKKIGFSSSNGRQAAKT